MTGLQNGRTGDINALPGQRGRAEDEGLDPMSGMSTQTKCEPVFLIGAERSGTTLFRLMLDHHPQITWLNEFEYVVDLIDANGRCPSLSDYWQWLSSHRVFGATGFAIDRSLDYSQLVDSFLEQQRTRTKKPIVGATVHRRYEILLRLWPNARFIHLVRDPRDVASSCVAMGWAGNVWDGVSRWIDAETRWLRLQSELPAERHLDVSYESLIADPESTLRRACGLIGTDYAACMLDYPRDTTYQRPDMNLLGQWSRKLSHRQVQLIESRVANMAVDRGYTLSGLPRMTLSGPQKVFLRVQNRLARIRFRIRRYGPALWLACLIVPRFGPKSWKQRVLLCVAAVDRTHLK